MVKIVTEHLNQKIIDHFLNPRNIGEIKNADGYAKVGDPACGDHICVWIMVDDGMIVDFKYKVFGCWGAISTTSVVSELAIGKSISEAAQLTDDDVIRVLDGIPENKQHCSLLGIQGLRAALANYLVRDNHKKYAARIAVYRSRGYDIPKLRKRMIDQLVGLSANVHILEVGTGKGHLALAIAQSGRRCTSIDFSRDEINIARLNAIHFGVDNFIDFQIQDAMNLPFPSQSFDAILTAAFFHHIEQPEAVLNELLRVRIPDGKLIISDINNNGQALIGKVHHDERRCEHVCVGWSIDKIGTWLQHKGYHVFYERGEFEDMLIV